MAEPSRLFGTSANERRLNMERENLRAQLFQSQKMEALGTLVGGIAHDFNNMLQIIVGYSEVLLLGKKEGDRDYVELQTIFKTAQQEAELVKRLITFAGKSPVKKIPVDLNYQIKELAAMLSHSFPTRHRNQVGPCMKGLSHIMADPGQIDQVDH